MGTERRLAACLSSWLLHRCVRVPLVGQADSEGREGQANMGTAGLILGGIIVGPIVNRYGRRWTIGGEYLVSIAGIFLQFFCTTPAQYFGSKLLTGVPLGAFATLAPTYASEMSPLAIRGAVTGGMNLAIVLGNTIGYGVLREANKYDGKMVYRLLFAVQWGFVAVCLAILPFLPE